MHCVVLCETEKQMRQSCLKLIRNGLKFACGYYLVKAFLPSPSPLTPLPLPLPSKRNKYDSIHSPHPLHLIMCIKLSNSQPVSNLIPWQSREQQLIAPRWLPLKLRSNYCCWSWVVLISSYPHHQRSSCYRRTSMDRITTIDWWWVQLPAQQLFICLLICLRIVMMMMMMTLKQLLLIPPQTTHNQQLVWGPQFLFAGNGARDKTNQKYWLICSHL